MVAHSLYSDGQNISNVDMALIALNNKNLITLISHQYQSEVVSDVSRCSVGSRTEAISTLQLPAGCWLAAALGGV